jgi:hypothetical protein
LYTKVPAPSFLILFAPWKLYISSSTTESECSRLFVERGEGRDWAHHSLSIKVKLLVPLRRWQWCGPGFGNVGGVNAECILIIFFNLRTYLEFEDNEQPGKIQC